MGSKLSRPFGRGGAGILVGAFALSALGCDAPIEPMELPGVATLLGPDGGTLRSADGALSIEFPAGALTEELEFRIFESGDAPPSIGPAFRISPTHAVAQKIAVTYRYVDVEGRELQALRIVRDIGEMWESLPVKSSEDGISVTALDDEVSFHYGLVEELEPMTVAEGGGGSSGGGKPPSGEDGRPSDDDDWGSSGGEHDTTSDGGHGDGSSSGGSTDTGGPSDDEG